MLSNCFGNRPIKIKNCTVFKLGWCPLQRQLLLHLWTAYSTAAIFRGYMLWICLTGSECRLSFTVVFWGKFVKLFSRNEIHFSTFSKGFNFFVFAPCMFWWNVTYITHAEAESLNVWNHRKEKNRKNGIVQILLAVTPESLSRVSLG